MDLCSNYGLFYVVIKNIEDALLNKYGDHLCYIPCVRENWTYSITQSPTLLSTLHIFYNYVSVYGRLMNR